MNDKESALRKIVSIVYECCVTYNQQGVPSMTEEELIGASRKENVCMARTILVCQLRWAGFTATTVADLLNRTVQSIRKMEHEHSEYMRSSRAYRIAISEATLRCKSVEPLGL